MNRRFDEVKNSSCFDIIGVTSVFIVSLDAMCMFVICDFGISRSILVIFVGSL